MSDRNRLSITNHLTGITAVTSDTAAAGFSALTMIDPAHPFRPWRSTTTASDQHVVFDLGSAKEVGMVLIVNMTNVVTLHVQMHATDSWGAPTYASGALTVGTNWQNGRKQLTHVLSTPQTLRWLRIKFVAASGSYFECGGVHAGPLVTMPRDIRVSPAFPTLEPHMDTVASHGGGRQRLILDDPIAIIRARRQALEFTDLQAWGVIDRAWRVAGYAAFYVNGGSDTSEGWIMRRMSDPEWTYDDTIVEDNLDMEEVTAG